MAEPFRMPAEATRSYREANAAQMRGFIAELTRRAGDTRAAFFAPRTDSLAHFQHDADALRLLFRENIGYPPNIPLLPPSYREQHLGEDDQLTVSRLSVSVAEGLDCECLLMTPKKGRAPLMIALHGGGGCPDTVCGTDQTAIYHAAGRVLACAGYTVCAPLLLFRPYADGADSCVHPAERRYLDALCTACGTRVSSIEALKILRCIDALQAHPGVTPGPCGIAGLSYGGYYALLCAALDTRIAVTYCSCIFGDHLRYMTRGDYPVSEFVWWQSEKSFAMPEYAALVCPRRLIIEAGLGDQGFPVNNAREQAGRVRRCFEELGLSDRFHYVEHPGGHEFGLGEAMRHLHF